MTLKIKNLINQKDEKIEIDNLTVLVGPNNSGKSRTLLDINDLFLRGPKLKKVLIKNIEFYETTFDEFTQGLRLRPSEEEGRFKISGLSPDLGGTTSASATPDDIKTNIEVINKNGFQNLCNLRISEQKMILLDAGKRLQIANKTGTSGGDTPNSLMQEMYEKFQVMDNLSSAFKQAFDMEIKLDYSGLAEIKFRVAPKFEEIPEDPRKAKPILEQYPLLDDQGDGFRSFVGIVLGVILTEGRIVLIDEPEAFLHPAQARVLGEWLARYSKKGDRQIIIATHSADILDGLLLGNNETTILRVNRTLDKTEYHHIPSEVTKQLSEIPILSSQPVLDSIFYKGVIINEGSSDRVVYRSVYSSLFEKREHLFIDSFGKQVIKKIVKPLKDAKIRVCAIPDLDILNSEIWFKELLDAIDENDHSELVKSRKEIAESVEGIKEEVLVQNTKNNIKVLNDRIDNILELTELRRELKNIRQKSGKWEIVKEKGIQGMPEEVREKAKTLLKDLKKIGIFLPPVGELESWIQVDDELWITGAIETIRKGKTPTELKEFVKEVIKFLEN